MEKITQPFETHGHDLTGSASLEFHDTETIQSFSALIPGMDINRFDPVAIKIFFSGDTPIVTLYAFDKEAGKKESFPEGKIPVRKFKTSVAWPDLFKCIKSFDLVMHDGKYNIEDIKIDKH